MRRHAQNIGQEARTLPPKPGVIVTHHRAFTPTSSVLFMCSGRMILFGLLPHYGGPNAQGNFWWFRLDKGPVEGCKSLADKEHCGMAEGFSK